MGARQPSPQKDKAVAFSRPEQVAEILQEADRLGLQVLIKTSADGKAIRGQMESFLRQDKTLRIGGISPAGDDMLRGHDFVKVEFILLSKKLVFVSPIRARANGRIVLGQPDKLVAIERRSNSRFRVPQSHAAFMEFPDRKLDLTRFDAPFIPRFMRDERNGLMRMRIDDVSLGGVACFTRHLAVADMFRSDEDNVPAVLYFPNMAPIQAPVSIRWTKKTTAAVPVGRFAGLARVLQARLRPIVGNDDLELRENYHRIGLQFSEVSKDLDSALRTFIKLVQTAESV